MHARGFSPAHRSRHVTLTLDELSSARCSCNDPADRSIKDDTHILLCLAFVLVTDVTSAFNAPRTACPAAVHGVFDFFKKNYATETPGRGNQKTVPSRYRPQLWNHYATIQAKSHRTNNFSEGWHNRFRQIVGEHHSDLYFRKSRVHRNLCSGARAEKENQVYASEQVERSTNEIGEHNGRVRHNVLHCSTYRTSSIMSLTAHTHFHARSTCRK